MTKVVHLHWSWRQGPKGAHGITIGVAVCGVTVVRKEFTSFIDDATCEECLERAKDPDPAA